jgi:hypothetical protein
VELVGHTPRVLRRLGLAVRNIAIVVMIGALLAGVTWGLERFLSVANGQWPTAISAVLAWVLVLVTVAYVYLTNQLVAAQVDAPREVARLSAAQRLSEASMRVRFGSFALTAVFPLAVAAPRLDPDRIERDVAPITAFNTEAQTVVLSLPVFLQAVTARAAIATSRATIDLQALSIAILREDELSLAQARPWSWDSAKTTYEAEIQGAASTSDWARVAAGTELLNAQQSIHELTDALGSYLRGESR